MNISFEESIVWVLLCKVYRLVMVMFDAYPLSILHSHSLENKMQVEHLKIHVARRYLGIKLLNFKFIAGIILSTKHIT